MNERFTELMAQGYPPERAAAMNTVEWALRSPTSLGYCGVCGYAWKWDHQHRTDCPIPAQGYFTLKAEHWYERRWCSQWATHVHAEDDCGFILGDDEQDIGSVITCCDDARGHDKGIHEPREGELT